MGMVRRVCRNVKRWRSASTAMRWTEALCKSSERLPTMKAHKQLPTLGAALEAYRTKSHSDGVIARQANAA